ncbi:tetratricopeptide repeat protein [Neptunomonas marina]|uniref:Tetratricopeptide repeat protein n=1 Tax=Neptunomonas marina TaxID=1815562 RepID=A0A437Q425_9GAMM|nr:tetratricopeptide repeat protein [Neptunomonas marina]RVU29266.1 tetratricopeptide repeat protein [Neptunomonas marina]
MKSFFNLSTLSLVILLAGCSTQSVYQPAVEDRSTVSKPLPENNSVVTPADPSLGVKVTPVGPSPVIRSQREEVQQEQRTKNPVPVAPAQVVRKQNPAVVALLDTAKTQTRNGQLRNAQTSLSRAQRISPDDPAVYYFLADTHRRLGEFLQAEQVALKGVATASGQNQQLYRLWKLVASIRSDAGDLEGANKADAVAKRYK